MYTKVIEVQRPKRALSLLTVLHNYSYILLFVSILLLLQMKRKSWYPYTRQLDIVTDNRNFESLEDTFLVMFTSNDAIEMSIGYKLTQSRKPCLTIVSML